MSLAQAPSFYPSTAAFNPFGPSATLGSDQIIPRHSPIPAIRATSESAPLHAPQGRVPTNITALAPPLPLSRPESKPDFMRGFGLDVTEEVEEPAEEPPVARVEAEDEAEIGLADEEDTLQPDVDADVSVDTAMDETDEGVEDVDGQSTVAQSRIHSRHVSRLSAALSLRSVGRVDDTVVLHNPAIPENVDHVEVEVEGDEVPEEDAVAEWTGSEDLRETDDEVRLTLFVCHFD